MQLALKIPFGPDSTPTPIVGSPVRNFDTDTTTIGSFVTSAGQVALYAGGFLMFFWVLWGIFDYIKAEGNKEALAKARKKIQWAIVGFIILVAAFFISDYLQPLVVTNTSVTPKPLEIK